MSQKKRRRPPQRRQPAQPRPAQRQHTQRQHPQRQPNQRRPAAPTGGGRLLTPGASPTRQAIERRSAPVLALLNTLPRPVFGVLPLALLLLGSFLPLAPALVCLLLALALLTWLAYLSWPAITGGQRALRVFVPLAVVAVAALRLTGR